MRDGTCKTCLVEHDEEIHEATERLHEWLRRNIAAYLQEPEDQPEAA